MNDHGGKLMAVPEKNSSGHTLTSIERAAILIKSLPIQQAAKIVDHLQPRELQNLFGKMKTLPKINDQQYVTVINDFMANYRRVNVAGPSGSLSGKRPVNHDDSRAKTGLPVAVETTVNVGSNNPFDFLTKTPDLVRHQLLVNEHPLNIAIVLSFLPSDVASTTLSSLDSEIRISVLRRLCEVDEFDPQDVANLSFVLKSRIQKILHFDGSRKAGVNIAARLLSCTDQQTQQQLVECLAVNNPEMACQLENSMFSFSDIQRLNDQDIKTILGRVDTSCWAPALKHSNLRLQKKILDNLAPRPRNILNREISEMSPIDSQIANHAQQQVVKVCLQLSDHGKIQLPLGTAMSPVV